MKAYCVSQCVAKYVRLLGMGNDCYDLIDIDREDRAISPEEAVQDVKPFESEG